MYNSFGEGNTISNRLIFGCASLMNIKKSTDRQKLLNTAYDQGLNHFDIAPIYGLGECERELGKFLINKDKVKITTKFGLGAKGISKKLSNNQDQLRKFFKKNLLIKKFAQRYYSNFILRKFFNINECKKSIENSLSILGIEKIEYYLLHDPSESDEIQIGIEEELIEMRDQGLFENYGISGNQSNLNLIYKNRPRLFKEVVQINGDIFKDQFAGELNKSKVQIKFGVLKSTLPKLKYTFKSFKFINNYWSNKLNIDLTVDENLSAVILAAALSKNNMDKIIFSTLKIERLEKMIDMIRNPIWDFKEIKEFSEFCAS